MNNCYEIVYGADDKFASIMGISIISLFCSNTDAKEINLTILDSGISRENKRKVENICSQFHRKLPRWIPITNLDDKLSLKLKADRGSLSQFARLFLSEAYSKEVNRALYLDCDTIVVSSIKALWNTKLKSNNIIAIVKDAFSKYYRLNIGLSSNAIMFNSGVMLIDLDQWRSNNIEKKLIDFIMSKHGRVQQGDQGILNAVLSDRSEVLSPKYNLVSTILMMNYNDVLKYRKPVNFYSKSDIQEAKINPVILHYTSGFDVIRPWVIGSNHPRKDDWLKYKRMSPWRDEKLKKDNRTYYEKLFYAFFNVLPKGIVLDVAGILQSYIRPWKNRIMY